MLGSGFFILNQRRKHFMAKKDDTVVTPSVETEEQPAVTEEPQVTEDLSEESEQLQETEPPLEDKILQKLQSWEGRKLKEFKDEIFGGIAGLLNQQQPQQPVQQQMVEESEPDPDLDIRSWYDWRKRKDQQETISAQKGAEQAYFSALNSSTVKHTDPQIHEAVMKEIQHNQNVDLATGRPMPPSADAILNYNNALRRVMEKKFSTDNTYTNPLQNNPPPGPGIGVSQPNAPGKPDLAAMPKLSPQAVKLVRQAGWNAEKVRAVLGKK